MNTLPIHAATGLRAIGFVAGRPVWPILGGSEDAEPVPNEGAENKDEGKTFTQADLDKHIEQRLSRERGKYADYEDLKKKAAEYEQFQEANASDQEKAIKTAAKEARSQALAEVAGKLAASEVRAQARDRVADVDTLIEGMNLSRFVKGDEIDTKAITDWLDKVAPAKSQEDSAPPWPDLAQGGRPAASTDPGFGNDRVKQAYSQRRK